MSDVLAPQQVPLRSETDLDADTARRVGLLVCGYARDITDARDLLEVLGIMEARA